MALLPFFSLFVAGLLGYRLGSCSAVERDGRATTVSRLSPDETTLARLIEISSDSAADRRFRVDLRSLVEPARSTVLFTSPEDGVGGPPGTERLIWSKDGTKLIVVGRHFFVKDDLFLDNGDQAFLIYDVREGRGWCNSDPPSAYPPLTARMIEEVEFTEPVRLKPR